MRFEDKQAAEREAVESFARVCELGIDPESIRSQEPPHPDIRCFTRTAGRVDLELVQLADPDEMSLLAGGCLPHLVMEEVLSSLAGPDSSRLSEQLGDASVGITFEGVSLRRRFEALPRIVGELLRLPTGFEGTVGLPNCSAKANILRRPGLSGPVFSFPSCGSIGEPDLLPVWKKFSRTYEGTGGTGLLIYYRWHALPKHARVSFAAHIWPDIVARLKSTRTFCWAWIADLSGGPEILASWSPT